MDKEACTNQGFISIIPNTEPLRMYLLHNLMNRREEILSNAKGSTYREINKSTFRSLDIMVPSIDVMKSFHEITYTVIEQTKLLQRQNQKLKQARDLLLPRLMNGEISV
jgi:type I restriction enzyme S subunit